MMQVGNQSPLPLIDLVAASRCAASGWESVTSPFDRLKAETVETVAELGISHLSL